MMDYRNMFFIITMTIGFVEMIICSDYCELETKYCFNKKHIGCEKNVFNDTVKPWNIQPITVTLKEFILNELNLYRSDVAMGKYISEGLTTASNMRSMRWDDEFANLAEMLLRKIPEYNYSLCADTETFVNVAECHFSQIGVYDDESLFHTVLTEHTSNSGNNLTISRFTWISRFYHASNYKIGCAFGNLTEKNITTTFIKCIQNKYGVRTVQEAYESGTACSKCSMWNEVCDDERYPGLCVESENNARVEKGEKGERGNIGIPGIPGPIGPPGLSITGEKGERGLPGIDGFHGFSGKDGKNGSPGLVGQKGDRGIPGSPGISKECKGDIGLPGNVGLPGPPGDAGSPGIECKHQQIDFEYPVSFWCLYSIMGLGFIISILFSLKIMYYQSKKLNEIEENMEFN